MAVYHSFFYLTTARDHNAGLLQTPFLPPAAAGRRKRGHLALRQRAVALCTRTSKRGIPNLAPAMDHNETYWYSTTYTFHKVQKYYALASEAGTFPGRDAIDRVPRVGRCGHILALAPPFPTRGTRSIGSLRLGRMQTQNHETHPPDFPCFCGLPLLK